MQNDDFVKEKLDLILLHHKNSNKFRMIAVLIKNFERNYFNVIKDLRSEVAYKLREELFTSLQVIDFNSVLDAHIILLRYIRNDINEV